MVSFHSKSILSLKQTNVHIFLKTLFCVYSTYANGLLHSMSVYIYIHIYVYVCVSYYGTGIKMGECGLTILNANHNHSGIWSCHMGATHIAGTDTFREISVRIAGINRLLFMVCSNHILVYQFKVLFH